MFEFFDFGGCEAAAESKKRVAKAAKTPEINEQLIFSLPKLGNRQIGLFYQSSFDFIFFPSEI
jgi:hypothetical protein